MATAKERKPLEKMTIEELEEVSRREEALLGNRALVSKLPDGGQKLRATLEEVRKLLAERGREGGQCQSLARGQLNDVLAAIEWRAKPKIEEDEERNGDSDDDDDVDEGTVSNQENAEKTLKMLASVACPPARKTRTVPPDSPGSGDLASLAAFLKTVRIDDAARTAAPSRRPKFVPNALPPEKRKPFRSPAATPVRKVEMMSLAESVAVHREAEARARRDEARFAASRLAIVSVSAPAAPSTTTTTTTRVGSLAASSVEGAASAGVGAGPSFSGYRERKDESESDGESCSREEEVDDDDDDDDDGS